MPVRSNLKIGVAGVRGIVGGDLTPALAAAFATAFGRYLGGGRVVVGRDTRPSGRMLEQAAVAGLLATGCQPIMLGIVPTPTIQLSVDQFNASGAIAITASHNPGQWNALKLVNREGRFLSDRELKELLDIYNQPERSFVTEELLRQPLAVDDAFAFHMKHVFSLIDVQAVRRAKFKVAVDCCRGVGALYSRRFLEALGCKVYAINEEPDGMFVRPPEPRPDNLGELSTLVKKKKCHVGFAQDPDGDRLALIDSRGIAPGEQYTLLLATDHLLDAYPGNVVINVNTSKAVEDIAESYGCEVKYSKVGEINVVGKMLETNAEIGGEGNCGGVIWRRMHLCRDSFMAMALILEMLALSGDSIDNLCDSLPNYHMSTFKTTCPAEIARKLVRTLRDLYQNEQVQMLDGFRVDFKDHSWVLIRPSNTEPVLRITTESRDYRQTLEMLRSFKEKIAKITGLEFADE